MKVFNMTTKQKCIHLFSFFQEKQKLPLSHWNSPNTSIIYRFSEGSCFTVIVLFPIKIIFVVVWRFNMDIRHIKITSTEGLYRINDKKAFKGLIVSITSSYNHNVTPLIARNTFKAFKLWSKVNQFQHIWYLTPVCLFAATGYDSVLPAELFKGVF